MSTPAQRGDARPPSFGHNLAKSLAFMLVCGMVGPLFIFFSFSSAGEGEGWMLWSGIAVTLLDVGLAFAFAAVQTRSQQRTWRLERVGRRGTAQILEVERTSVTINDQPQYKIHVRVTGDDLTPFEARRRMVVSFLHIGVLTSGSAPVLVDPETGEWEFDWDAARSTYVQQIAQVNAAPAVAAPQDRSPTERLAELDDLLKRDLIGPEEYDEARRRIIDAI